MTRLITVFGGSGFVGRHVVRALAQRGWRVRVAVRRPDLAGHLQPMGNVGQVMPVQANLRYPDSVAQAVKGADGVVNLVGILYESGRQSFEKVQAEGPETVARAARQFGIEQVVHVSAIGADANAEAAYARTKAAGEAGVLRHVPGGRSHSEALDRVWAGGQFLQPVRSPGADPSGVASDRRR